MFDIELLDKFYTFTGTDTDFQEVDEEVRNAYLMFIGDLVPVISLNWKQYIKGYVKGMSEPSYLNNNLTVSDEAYTLWLVKRFLPGIVDEIKNNIPRGRKGRKGPHLTNTYRNEYIELFRKLNEMRNPNMDHEKYEAYIYYEKMFFESFFTTKGINLKSSKAIAYGTSQLEQHLVMEEIILNKPFDPMAAKVQSEAKDEMENDSSLAEANAGVGLQAQI
jgi:hypothetical protein